MIHLLVLEAEQLIQFNENCRHCLAAWEFCFWGVWAALTELLFPCGTGPPSFLAGNWWCLHFSLIYIPWQLGLGRSQENITA